MALPSVRLHRAAGAGHEPAQVRLEAVTSRGEPRRSPRSPAGVRGRVGRRRVAVGKAAWVAPGRPLAWARRLRRRGALEGFST